MIDIDFLETHGILKTFLYLLDHPEGKRKTDIRIDCNLTTNASIKVHQTLFKNGCLEIIGDPPQILFALSRKGIYFAQCLKDMQKYKESKL